MNAAAIHKIAKFFGVDPLKIDPDLFEQVTDQLIPAHNSTSLVRLTYPSKNAVAVTLEKQFRAVIGGEKYLFGPPMVMVCERSVGNVGPFLWETQDGVVGAGDQKPKSEKLLWVYRMHSVYVALSKN